MRGYREQKHQLFGDGHLSDVLRHWENKMVEEIDQFEGNYILNTSVEDLCDYLEQKYKLDPPVLTRDETYIASNGETDVDVSKDGMRQQLISAPCHRYIT